jgi:hypothetical protein
LGIYEPTAEKRSKDEIKVTRLVTLTCVILIYLGYSVLRIASKGDISTMLYAIWSFQIAIAPAVLTALLTKMTLSRWTIPIAEAWSMMPPLFVVIVSSFVFLLLTAVHRVFGSGVSMTRPI